jgi:hypothetical protein
MTSKLGWVQFTRSLDASRASARRTGWGDDERPARRSHRGPRPDSRSRVLLLRPGRTLVVIALVAVTIASWVM